MFITEQGPNKWVSIIKEELGVSNPSTLKWMSQYAAIHELFESQQANATGGQLFATPLGTIGMGNISAPGTIAMGGADFHAHDYGKGSGDIPGSMLTAALEVAATTIGLELVGVVPMTGPWMMLQYFDHPYAGGKLGRINETTLDGKGEGIDKPLYIKVSAGSIKEINDILAGKNRFDKLTVQPATGTQFEVEFYGKSRIDGGIIVRLPKEIAEGTLNSDQTIKELFSGAVQINGKGITSPVVDLVAGMADHIQGFANFAADSAAKAAEPMTRGENETGLGNVIGTRSFTKWVQAGAYEVVGTATRQQIQDLPRYGYDVIGKVIEAMQNELSQSINNRILDRVFRLGVTNAKLQKSIQGVDLNLFLANAANATKDITTFRTYSKLVGVNNEKIADAVGDWVVTNGTHNTAAENLHTHQRRIASRCLAATNLIANVSRFGRANWVVTNVQVLSALQDVSGYVAAPASNNLVQGGERSIYFAGTLMGMNIYVDPNMEWDDTRVCVGRKSNGDTPGVIFCPYILADQISITAEGTMAPKILLNSRFAIVDCGFHPEQNYFTFAIETDGSGFII